MQIGIVGLGLIGGSLARTIKAYTTHTVHGYDIDSSVIKQAKIDGAIDDEISTFDQFDIILIALFPHDTIAFLEKYSSRFSSQCIVIDTCGVKQHICDVATELFKNGNGEFLGGHPMAGREVIGYSNSLPTLFQGASMIFTPTKENKTETLTFAEDFFLSLGFGQVTFTTPEHHDQVIAYTSQLAHVVSSAYMQSPIAQEFMGFSANSFADLTRVAKLNPDMWTELFLCNRKALAHEVSVIIDNLIVFQKAIATNDEATLHQLLAEGNEIKIRLNDRKGGHNGTNKS